MVEVVQASSPGISAESVASLSSPDLMDTPFGVMEFFDGVPLGETAERSYDALDLLRGVDAFLNCMPGASMLAMRNGLRSIGARSNVIACTDPRSTSAPVVLTANTETTYGTTFLDLRSDGPTVIECPPNSLSFVDDLWQRYVADMGNAGPDRGHGGKYLFLPPGHDSEVPDDYFVFESPTYSNWVVIRALDGLDALLTTRIYPLAAADDPPETGFVDMAETSFNGIHANDFRFFEEVNEIIQEEPEGSLDPERAGQLAAIGIVHGRPFQPDTRLRAILEQAAHIGAGIARTLLYKPRDPDVHIFQGASWKTAFVGGSYEFLTNGARMLDYRALMHYVGTGITPAMTHAAPGIGPQYASTVDDANGDTLDGAQTYTLTLPAPIPVATFWAIEIYDTQTRSLLQTDNPYPSINNRLTDLHTEPNGDVIIHFGPQPPTTTGDVNWLRTIPAKSWSRSAPLRTPPSLVRPHLATRRDPTRRALATTRRRRSPARQGARTARGGPPHTTSSTRHVVRACVAFASPRPPSETCSSITAFRPPVPPSPAPINDTDDGIPTRARATSPPTPRRSSENTNDVTSSAPVKSTTLAWNAAGKQPSRIHISQRAVVPTPPG